MSTAQRIILVTGATGHQGGAVARHLLQSDWHVRALTRDPSRPAAQELAALGAEVVQGDMDQPESLEPVLEGVYGVYGVQNFWEVGYEREIAEGQSLIDAAWAARVQHFVYSSVGGAERKTGLPHFECKWLIEEHLRASGLASTILRPVFFMENLLRNREEIKQGTLSSGLPPEVPLQMIAVCDIGGFAALAFEHPEDWIGRAVELAGDELTGPQTCAKLSAAVGHEVRYQAIPLPEMAKQNPEYALMFQWFLDHGYEADIPALRAAYPPLKRLEDWLKTVSWE
jgi:uncharacterized protein YbjT (DUF2867 family)